MKVFFDSNVVLDVLLNRQEFIADSMASLKLSELHVVKGFISVVSITDIFYLLKKNIKDFQKAIEKLQILFEIVNIGKADGKIAFEALNSGWKDFEDAVQNFAAVTNGNIKGIITRNAKDFCDSQLQIIDSRHFL